MAETNIRQDPPGPGINKISLFIVALIASILFNIWIQWNKPSELNDIERKIEMIREKLKKLVEFQAINNKCLSSKKSDENDLKKMFSIEHLINEARRSMPQIWFASNETKVPVLVKVAQNILQQDFYTCQHSIILKFDPYRNCFRSLSIEFHNRLSLLDDSHWFTVVGRLQYAFMITTLQSKRNEYLFAIGNIYFQVIEFEKLLTMPFRQSNELMDEQWNIEMLKNTSKSEQTESSNNTNH